MASGTFKFVGNPQGGTQNHLSYDQSYRNMVVSNILLFTRPKHYGNPKSSSTNKENIDP